MSPAREPSRCGAEARAPRRAEAPPRAVAADLLAAVLERGRPLDPLLEEEPRLVAMAARDRAFVRLLLATTLRRLGQIDAALEAVLTRPLDTRGAQARGALRLGAAQLLFLGTPAHAAVAESVTLAPAFLRGLVNAALRRLAREGAALIEAQDAARMNTPDWLWESWAAAHGVDTARRIAEAHLCEPPLDITVKADPEVWAGRLEAVPLPTGTLRRAVGGAVVALPGYREGAWWVQDAATALPARLLGAVAGRRVIDLCAAPGGKAAQLAAAGARVTAVDRSESRLGRMAENMARLGLAVEPVAADAATWRPPRPADAVLLDAPCSATGTIRRHPDVARLKTPEDVARLGPIQDRLLEAAVAMTAPGGTLVYGVCSLQGEEGPARIAALLARGAPMRRRPIEKREVGGLGELITKEGDLMTLPCHLAEAGGLDGFFAARLERL